MSTRRNLVTLGIALVAAASIPAAPETQLAVAKLDASHQPLVDDFNAREGRARLVVVLSPT